eukprot:PhM_4_TR2573/c0_g1_i1/m.47940/K15119/SLC25A39_40; solute carrier family 25, member 39/40
MFQSGTIPRDAFASTMAASTTVLFVTPFDVVKSSQQFHGAGVTTAIRGIVRDDGISGFYRGLSPSLTMAVPSSGFYYVLYEQTKKIIARHVEPNSNLAWYGPALAGMSSRTATTCLVLPLELVKTHAQTRSRIGFTVGGYMREIMRTEGVRGLWTGLTPTLLRDVPFSGIYWLTLEQVRRHIEPSKRPDKNERNTWWVNVCTGAGAGALASILTHPADAVKTVMQGSMHRKSCACSLDGKSPTFCLASMSMQSAVSCMYRAGRWQAFFRGGIARTMKVAPACAVMITVFDLIR